MNFESAMKMKLDSDAQSGAVQQVNIYAIGPGYFDTFGAHILAGRDFDASDVPGKPQFYIISEHLAKAYFHGQNPIGGYLLHDGRKLPVVGVVSDIRDQELREASMDTVYQDAGQLLTSGLTVFVRCDGPCARMLPSLRTATRESRFKHSDPCYTYRANRN